MSEWVCMNNRNVKYSISSLSVPLIEPTVAYFLFMLMFPGSQPAYDQGLLLVIKNSAISKHFKTKLISKDRYKTDMSLA